MMLGGAFILLKAPTRTGESGEEAEPRVADLRQILRKTARGARGTHIPPDMANSMKVASFVMQVTFSAWKLTQYSAVQSSSQL
jgi:hypothetical protein